MERVTQRREAYSAVRIDQGILALYTIIHAVGLPVRIDQEVEIQDRATCVYYIY